MISSRKRRRGRRRGGIQGQPEEASEYPYSVDCPPSSSSLSPLLSSFPLISSPEKTDADCRSSPHDRISFPNHLSQSNASPLQATASPPNRTPSSERFSTLHYPPTSPRFRRTKNHFSLPQPSQSCSPTASTFLSQSHQHVILPELHRSSQPLILNPSLKTDQSSTQDLLPRISQPSHFTLFTKQNTPPASSLYSPKSLSSTSEFSIHQKDLQYTTISYRCSRPSASIAFSQSRYWKGRPSWQSLWRFPLLLLHLVLLLLPRLSMAADTECRLDTWQPTHKNRYSQQCVVWTSATPSYICEFEGTRRHARLKTISIFQDSANVSLLDMLNVGARSSRRSSRREVTGRRLKRGVQGSDCLLGDTSQCLSCFRRIDTAMIRLQAARNAFERVLSRFDCLKAEDTSTATRPFSPNTTCEDCKIWYGRWLAAQLLDIWSSSPCIDWCFSAQLACPHLATSKVVDYAGHPSFQCRDLDIPSSRGSDGSTCSCIHPCDIEGIVPSSPVTLASLQLCEKRRRACSSSPHSTGSSSSNCSSIFLFLALFTYLIS